ncbi:hypothetical protein AAG906_024908 [Vitis piasezkii]
MHDLRETHLQAAYYVLHYLKDSPGKGVLFKRNNELTLEAYTYVDYVGSSVDRRSTFGYCTFLGGNLITWRSKKQNLAINIAHNLVQPIRTKHIEIDKHFIKEKLEGGSQLADVLAKGLNGATFDGIISKLGMENIYSLT